MTKIFIIGESHKHLKRVQESVITHSETSAPMYFLYKDHKKEPGWRPVVSGCNSNTLGISNILSDIIESICNAIEKPYEVISSEDMLHRIEKCNRELEQEIKERRKEDPNWDWREKYVLIGSDVEALFPSMSATRTAKIVREQAEKSKIVWENIDPKWLCLYIHLNRGEIDGISEIEHLLPKRTPGRRGKEAGLGSLEAKRREVRESGEGNWVWPAVMPTERETRKLIGMALEIAVKMVFTNFIYTFGGESYLQGFGGPIGARLTMAASRLVMQDWHEHFILRLKESKLFEKLGGLYVDDGRNMYEVFEWGTRFIKETGTLETLECWKKEDEERNRCKKELTQTEIQKLMNDINIDLRFTTEREEDFDNRRLPTLSFEMWCDPEGIRHSYFEKPMRSQILTMNRSSQAENSKFSILVNELSRRFEMMDNKITTEEKIETIDHFTQQLVNSEYNEKQIKEIIVSSLKGIKRKERKVEERKSRYRSAEESLMERLNKKLLEATTWSRMPKKS